MHLKLATAVEECLNMADRDCVNSIPVIPCMKHLSEGKIYRFSEPPDDRPPRKAHSSDLTNITRAPFR